MIFTDNRFLRDYEIPANVKLTYINFAQLESQFSSKLQFEVVIGFPYKLCDFKPAYGFIFEEYLAGYDFWGHFDLDIIFGDIRFCSASGYPEELTLHAQAAYRGGQSTLGP